VSGVPRSSLNALSPKKLLLTKWTAVTPRGKEKHILVVKLVDPEPPLSPAGVGLDGVGRVLVAAAM
jgi:hypothetical protein